ncbi:ABC1 family-domain-containing protein [Dunaliella salina]|uniref:ABC1 family-domain-containing protein n=1 Tax=Dunaliella salina TaxID=3046 RepID=A0ABQ7GSU8_DUNSA|nr:ABC1 family-domain-containing protein [Dunaliella salina]|eukprot:KAF5837683.1 ABC1 family-domain-containing protein [Dunaliella salina]
MLLHQQRLGLAPYGLPGTKRIFLKDRPHTATHAQSGDRDMPSARRRRSEGGSENGADSSTPGTVSFRSRAAAAAAAEAAVLDKPGTSTTGSSDSKPGPLEQLASPASLNPTASVTTTGTRGEVIEAEVLEDRPSDADFAWAQDDYSVTQRTIDTWAFFIQFRTRLYLLDKKWAYAGGYTEEKKKQATRRLAAFLLESVLDLGPTFIKLGQLSSTRSDLFPVEFVEELSKLQDRVPAFSAEKARAIIEKDLGQPLERLYKEFDPRPIAAASLGQVHTATLWSGEKVVVKVQRPGLRKLFDIDLNNLRILAEQLDKQDEANRDFRGIYQECASVLYDEIDYINEGRNADRFRRNFRNVPWVRVPTVHWENTSPRVITLEYLPGPKISSKEELLAAGLQTDIIAQRATEAYLIQILRNGFFHADPHPGNVSVDSQGRLLFYDFGMMGQIPGNVRERLLQMFYGIYRKDSNAVIDALVNLGVIKTSGDNLSIKRSINFFIENITRQTERQETISTIGEDLFAIAVDQPFRFPATFTFVLRAFSTLEGIGKSLNPDYNFSKVATPYAQELLQLQDAQGGSGSQLLELAQQQATELGSAAAAMPLRVSRIDAFLSSVEAGDTKLRVRVLEAERAARRSGVMQAATLHAVGALGFINLGTTLAISGLEGPAAGALGLAAVFGVKMFQGFRRIERLDKFESDLKG